MKPPKSSHWYRSAVSPFPAFCYLLVLPVPNLRDLTSELTLAQALSTQEREELEQLRSERRVQAQAQAEVITLSRATTLFNVC